jgi:hypothetical protein
MKTLMQIDPVYNSVSEFMSDPEKISYCESLIVETEQFLEISTNIIDIRSKERYYEIIVAAKIEIERLSQPKPQ